MIKQAFEEEEIEILVVCFTSMGVKSGVKSLIIYLKPACQKKGFRYYLAGLLGESKRKNIAQMTNNLVGASYDNIYHFISQAKWDEKLLNDRRLKIMNKGNQTRIRNGFSLIIDDSGHRKSGNFTSGVGRQYLGEIGKTENGIRGADPFREVPATCIVTSHLYDGVRTLPLDVELYQSSSSLPIEKFYREAKGWLGLKEYQVRNKTSLIRHFFLVFVAYTFMIYQQLMGGLRTGYAHKPLTNFTETLEAFLTSISYNLCMLVARASRCFCSA